MKYIITNLSNLYSHQSILLFEIIDHTFLIPGSMYVNFMHVVASLGSYPAATIFSENIAVGKDNGLLKELSVNGIENADNDGIIKCALEFNKTEEGRLGQILIFPNESVPLSPEQLEILQANNIGIYRASDLQELSYQQRISQRVSDRVSLNDSAELNKNLIAALIATLLLILSAVYLPRFFSYLPSWLWIPLIILGSVVLFWLRGNYRLFYGVVEFVVGVIAVVYGFTTQRTELVSFFLAILSGLYVMVRGIDNVFKSISNTKLARRLIKLRFKQ